LKYIFSFLCTIIFTVIFLNALLKSSSDMTWRRQSYLPVYMSNKIILNDYEFITNKSFSSSCLLQIRYVYESCHNCSRCSEIRLSSISFNLRFYSSTVLFFDCESRGHLKTELKTILNIRTDYEYRSKFLI